MSAIDTYIRPPTKLNEYLKRSQIQEPVDSVAAYQSVDVIKRLSKGKFPVYLTTSKINKKNYAMKIFSYKGEKSHPYFRNEIRFSILKHQNIINTVYFEKEKDTSYRGEIKKVSYILMEFAPHGDFFDFVVKHKDYLSLDEKLIRTYFRQLINGIEYLHASRVAHLDIKPENLLIGEDFNMKITDYDLSYVAGDSKIISRGTCFYRAPEFFRAGSSDPEVRNPFAADIYSAGIILFILKSGGMYPHAENTEIEGMDLVDLLYNKNHEFWRKHCEIQEKPFHYFDQDFKDLFNRMVRFNPEERLSITEIKQSKWYNGPVYTPVELQNKMKKLLRV